jgi:V/A-type H+-transporting ATPase subunit C
MDDYAYINARIRALRSELLGQRAYEELLTLPDLHAVRDYLGRMAYGMAPGEVLEHHTPIQIMEEWLRNHWSRVVMKMYGMTDGQPRELLEILLGRWEVENIKAIFRGKKADMGMPEILAAVLSTRVFDEASLAELARQPSIQAMVDLLTTWRSTYARPLRTALKGQRELKGIESLELALDHYYLEDAIKRLKGGDHNASFLRKLMGLVIDKTNLLTAFKIASQGVASPAEIPEYFIEGGEHVPIQIYDAVVRARGLREVVETIRKTSYADVVEGLEREQGGMSPSSRLERGLDRIILHRVKAMSWSDPLGIGLMAGYLFQKYHEISNLRIILRSKIYDMYPEDVRSLLVM